MEEATRNVMKTLMSNELAAGYNFLGKSPKLPFSTSILKQVVIGRFCGMSNF